MPRRDQRIKAQFMDQRVGSKDPERRLRILYLHREQKGDNSVKLAREMANR